MRRALPLGLVLAGCTAAPFSPVTGLASPAPDLVPVLLSPAVEPGLRAPTGPRAAPSTPAAAAPVARVESGTFFLDFPATWQVESRNADPEALSLVADAGAGRFTVATRPLDRALAAFQAEEEVAAAPGLVASAATSVDGLGGFLVTSNRVTAEGKLSFAVRGFAYRGRYYAVTARWDKRAPEAARVGPEIQAILTSFGWL